MKGVYSHSPVVVLLLLLLRGGGEAVSLQKLSCVDIHFAFGV